MNPNQTFPTNLILSDEIRNLLESSASTSIASSIEELESLATPNGDSTTVRYELPDGAWIDEVDVVKVKNGTSANYREAYMRRRDPDCMVVADDRPSDKPRFKDRFDFDFETLRGETFDWLRKQDLAVFGFEMGQPGLGGDAIAIAPANAGFFALGLGLLQGILDIQNMGRDFEPTTIIYVAPPFRQTHFDGKQVVVHHRGEIHEIFSYNLYPGPSAKKGVYGALIELGEAEGWITAHCSAVRVVTPYDNETVFMHEGASGGGKSEMLQQPHRQPDGRLLLGRNTVTDDKRYLEIPRTCDLHPVCDDMGLCHPAIQKDSGKLALTDAENAWFVRVDHINRYGTDPDLEKITIHPTAPLLFLNINAPKDSTALIWEHIEDTPGKTCPNPRVVLPRQMIPNIHDGVAEVDIRSFGVRTPPCTREAPNYGILGLVHILPPALAWLWRLVAPRGHANPSIVGREGMSSEGVGSYWPFSTGRKVAQANLLLKQFTSFPETIYVLIPNQHVGAWETGFMPQWIVRDYFARRGHAKFHAGLLAPSRCPLLGFAMNQMRVEGAVVPPFFFKVELQPEVGPEAFDAGAAILTDFFHTQLKKFRQSDLDPLGRQIIDCCLDGGAIEDYQQIIGGEDA